MSDILTHTEDRVMTITFNRPQRKNSLTNTMYEAMYQALVQAEGDKEVRVVVFQGDIAVFTAGNDLMEFLNNPPATWDTPVARFLNQLSTLSKPVLAAVCGPAVGVGFTMLLHCDMVYAGDNAAFSVPFVNLGVCPEAGSSYLLPQMFGYHRAAEILMTGDPIMAEAALEVGLVNRILPPTEVNSYAQAQARKLAAKPMQSLIETKRFMKKAHAAQVQATMDEEGQTFLRMLKEPAAIEAFKAFGEKRKPDFSQL